MRNVKQVPQAAVLYVKVTDKSLSGISTSPKKKTKKAVFTSMLFVLHSVSSLLSGSAVGFSCQGAATTCGFAGCKDWKRA